MTVSDVYIIFNNTPIMLCTFFSSKFIFCTHLFQYSLLYNNVFVMHVINLFGRSVISTDIQKGNINNLLG